MVDAQNAASAMRGRLRWISPGQLVAVRAALVAVGIALMLSLGGGAVAAVVVVPAMAFFVCGAGVGWRMAFATVTFVITSFALSFALWQTGNSNNTWEVIASFIGGIIAAVWVWRSA